MIAATAALAVAPRDGIAASADDDVAEDVAGAALFDALSEIGLETHDPLLLVGALRALAWSLGKSPERGEVMRSQSVMDVRARTLLEIDDEPDLAGLVVGFGSATRDARGAVGVRQSFTLSRGERVNRDLEFVTSQPLIVDVTVLPRQGARGLTSTTPLVHAILTANTRQVDACDVAAWERLRPPAPMPNAAYALSLRNLADVDVDLSFCCKQGGAQ